MKKYVQVGCGTRGVYMYSIPLVERFSDVGELCGVYDVNIKRAQLVSKKVGKDIPVYTDFDEMLSKVKPDTVIVTPIDREHDTYVIKALKAGCDVICEKPLTTTFEKALAIKKAQEESGKNVIVTFNLRFHPFFWRIKEIVATGIVGDVYSINYEWMLDTIHGASYFRRWHSERKNSGSLLVHKSTHHFDIINWILGQDPVEVNAIGSRRFYGSEASEEKGERCLTCEYKDKCKYPCDIINEPFLKEFYFDCEDEDGYIRDRCLYSDKIDIEDTVNLSVRYSGGTMMNYMLTAHSPYEGLRLVLNGSKGRLEIGKILGDKANFNPDVDNYIKFYNRNGEVIDIAAESEDGGGHGGADPKLQESLFRGHEEEPLGQMADTRAGMMSIGIGMAANISMKENRRVYLKEFFEELKDYE